VLSVTGDASPAWHEGFVATRETHAAVVFLVGDRAYKLKKPVNLGFLEFHDLAGSAGGVSA
jgi:aminoglycoside phosphotransferase family enzyme